MGYSASEFWRISPLQFKIYEEAFLLKEKREKINGVLYAYVGAAVANSSEPISFNELLEDLNLVEKLEVNYDPELLKAALMDIRLSHKSMTTEEWLQREKENRPV